MSKMLKHVGEIANTSKRCAVVFLQLPEDPAYALVIDTEAVPPRFHQPLMDIIESHEGQGSNSLADILNRRLMPDTGRTMLQTFHETGYLQKVLIDNINLTPRPNAKHKLRDVLVAMGKTVPTHPGSSIAPADTNFYQKQQAAQTSDATRAVAEGLLQQANLLMSDAHRLQEQAYAQFPGLRPSSTVSLNETPVEVQPQTEVETAAAEPVAVAPDVTIDTEIK